METLVHCIDYLQKKYKVQVYLEPGEAVVLNAGYLVATVLEVMHNHKDIAILDTSAACHMPDVLEVPYRPPVYRGGEPGKKAFTYLLTGRSCLAGASSVSIRSMWRSAPVSRSCSRTWRSTPWSRPIRLTACRCRSSR